MYTLLVLFVLTPFSCARGPNCDFKVYQSFLCVSRWTIAHKSTHRSLLIIEKTKHVHFAPNCVLKTDSSYTKLHAPLVDSISNNMAFKHSTFQKYKGFVSNF